MYRSIVEIAGQGIWMLDAANNTSFVNPRMAALLGYQGHELVGRSWLDLLSPQCRATASRLLGVYAGAPAEPVEVTLLHQAGHDIWVTMDATPLRDYDVAYRGALIMVSDITERRAQDRALRDARERMQQVFMSSMVGTAVVALDGRILEVNPALEKILGCAAADLAARRLSDFFPREQQAAFAASLAELRVDGKSRIYAEVSLSRDDGRPLAARLAIVVMESSNGESFGVCQIEDVTARKHAEDGLVHQRLHDGLTGLPNRTLLRDRLTQALSCRDQRDDSVAVLVLDVDRFKLINDTYGHSMGDALLIQIGRRLELQIRPEDTVARLDGDEFVVLLTDVPGRPEVLRIAERARLAIGEVVSLGTGTIVPSVSIGIAFSAGEDQSSDDLLQRADTAMYSAKESGRNRCEVFVSSASTLSGRRLRTEGVLHRALATGQLLLYYQPVLDLTSGRLTGAEALLRVVDAQQRVLEPREFLEVAEDTGQIVAMGRWAMEEAIRTTSAWQKFADTEPFQVSVNLSARQLVQVGFSQMVRDLVTANGLPVGALCLELTESVLMDQDSSPATLGELARAGMGIALDDFGTGFCSLSYLRRYPVDRLKIDRMFVAGLGKSTQDEAIVRAIVGLGQALDLDITAEGVETPGQAAALRTMDCPHVQGFLYGRPMPAKEFEQFAAQRSGAGSRWV
jgi:diguanylate cyclase (GGDEF)-like protein/PAS domain S-box-containing protein